MEIKTYDDVLKLQQQFADQLAERLQLTGKSRPRAVEQMIAERQATVKESQKTIADLEKARDEANRRFDGELRRLRERIARAEADIGEIEKTRAAAPKPAASRAKKSKPAATGAAKAKRKKRATTRRKS
jgi:hypothetical protein